MKFARVIIVAALLTTALSVQADARRAPQPTAPTPAEIVAARQAAMGMAAVTLGSIKTAYDGGAAAKSQAFAARGLARWGAALPSMFADSTRATTPTRAKPEVWQDKVGYAAKAADFTAATAALLAAAQADDRVAMGTALASTGAACKACHDSFQAPPPPRPAG